MQRVRLMFLPALRARADIAQVLPRVNAGRVAVAPVDADGVVAHRLDAQHLQRGLVHLERRSRARRAFRLARRRAGNDVVAQASARELSRLLSAFATKLTFFLGKDGGSCDSTQLLQ